MAFLPHFYFCFCDDAQLCAPNSIRDLNGRSYPTYPILRVLFGQLADNVLLVLVQRIIDTAVHRHSGDCPPARTDRQSGRIKPADFRVWHQADI